MRVPTPNERPLSPGTVAVSSGRPAMRPDAPLNTPMTPASTFVAGGDREYGRYANPTWEAFETTLGRLEGGRAVSYSSGLAAVAAILDLVAPGETVVAPRHAYNGVLTQMAEREQRGMLQLRPVDVDDTEAVVAASRDAALVWVESPTNPALEVADIAAVCAGAHENGARVVVDNTFATPLLQRPLELGADLVLHSGTKYLAGHSDALIGAVVTREEQAYEALAGRRRTVGSVPGTLEAWLAARGIRTLHVRIERAQANAQMLAERLRAHPAVARVRYPGFGAVIGIEVAGGGMAADVLTHSGELVVHATSLGGVESTWERRRRWSSEPSTIPDSLVRMSVGIEDVDDLWADIEHALGQLPT